MKIKLKQKQLLKIFAGLVIILILILIGLFIFSQTKPYYSVKTPDGNVYSFREDVKIANKTYVYPNEDTLRQRFLNTNLTKISFVFIPGDDKTNGYYAVWAVELGFKLTQFYNSIGYVTGEANIVAQPVHSIKNVTNDPEDLKIVIVPLNETGMNKVVVDGNIVYLYGRNPKQMDHVVMKTILVVLGNWTLAS